MWIYFAFIDYSFILPVVKPIEAASKSERRGVTSFKCVSKEDWLIKLILVIGGYCFDRDNVFSVSDLTTVCCDVYEKFKDEVSSISYSPPWMFIRLLMLELYLVISEFVKRV